MKALFHLAYHVTDLDAARAFYGGVLGCREGRSTDTWVDFDFFGHQLSLHLGEPFRTTDTGRVGDKLVPMPHLGLVLRARRLAGAGEAADRRRHRLRARAAAALRRPAGRAVDDVLPRPVGQPDRGQGLRARWQTVYDA